RDRVDADAELREVARGADAHRVDATLGRGVGDLPDLALVGGHGGGVDDDATLAVLVHHILRGHGLGGQTEHVERAHEVHRDGRLEQVEVVDALPGDDPGGGGDASAVDHHA